MKSKVEVRDSGECFWRVEGSLLNLSAVRPVAFFTWNAQSFSERWAKRGGLALSALVRPLLYSTNRVFATRFLHGLLRGVSNDRLDLLGEEYFNHFLKPRLNELSLRQLRKLMDSGKQVVLVSQALDHIMRPLAQYLGVERFVGNRMEFRDGLATGRLLSPVIRPRGAFARITGGGADGHISRKKLLRDLGLKHRPDILQAATLSSRRPVRSKRTPLVVFNPQKRVRDLSVKGTLAGKRILLIGTTGFIGKVWLAELLMDLPEIGRIYLLIRRQRSTSAQARFEKIVQQSPVFHPLHEKYGADLARFLGERIEVVEGDVTQPGIGLAPDTRRALEKDLDVIVNSSGLTDFNPDLRQAISINVDATNNLIEFLRGCDRAAMLHLSTCYVVGERDGRIREELEADYTPAGTEGFDAIAEIEYLSQLVRDIQAQSETREVTDQLLARIKERNSGARGIVLRADEAQLKKIRARWVRNRMIESGMQRAKVHGWPNTYTFTKSLAESLIAHRAKGLAVAIVRPSIVETSTHHPFPGWNEGVNTSAPISYLLGTFFRQLPSNGRKCLDLIPVDLVCRGMTLISTALVARKHEAVYQLATSATNPCNMKRSVELTALAHRKFYLTRESFLERLPGRFDSITVSKGRYQRLSAPGQKAVVRAIQRLISPLPLKRPPFVQKERGLDRVEKLIELYEPFILNNEYVFEAENIKLLSEALVKQEADAFSYDAGYIDWWDYWINIHIPALRKWSYPLIEGRPLEPGPTREFQLSVGASAGASNGGGRRLGDEMIGTEAT